MGTLVRLADPFRALHRELGARGAQAPLATTSAALRAEMRFYREHCATARDAASLKALRRRCAGVLAAALGPELTVAAGGEPGLLDALLAALRFEAYPDATRALARWRAGGSRLAVVSNWDVSLHDVLAGTGLSPMLDLALSSAEAGASKPAASIFARALEMLGAGPSDAVHVGDTVSEDVLGARAAGIAPVLVVRDGGDRPAAVASVASLDELWR